MASRDLGVFSLRLLEIARTSTSLTFEDMFVEYKELYGPMPWASFSKRVVEGWEAGYYGLANGTFPGAPDSEFAVELVTEGARKGRVYKSLYTKLDGRTIDAGVEKLKEELGVDLLRNANRDLFDAMLRHQIMLLKMDRTVRDDVFRILDATEKDLAKQIASRLGDGGRSMLGTRRLQLLEDVIKNTRLEAWDQINEKWVEDLIQVAKSEVETTKGIVQTAAPVSLELVLPNTSTLKAIAKTNPFQGRTLKQWADNIADADIQRIMDQIKIGLVQGETGDQIAARVVGTARLKYTDGVTQITRNNAEAITRTAVNAITHAARDEFFSSNQDIFDRERFVATLDGRTTPQCRANDGKVYPRGEGPQPPLHFNCRSVRIPYFAEDALYKRPARAFTEKGLLRQFAEQEGLDTVPASRDALPFGYKTLYDQFARTQMRLATSIVPGTETYQTWLMRQPKQFITDILGPTRAKLFNTGQLTLDKFVDTSGKNMSLSDLARSHAAAFRSAGLDPEDFL